MTISGAFADLPLGINPWLLLAQIVNFGILYWILSRFVFPSLMKTMDDRATTIRQGVENANNAKLALNQANQQADGIIQEARHQSQQIIAEGTTAGERVRAQIEEEARARADEIARQAQQRIAQEEAQARNALRQQVADLAISAAGYVVGESLDGPKQRRLVEEFIAQSDTPSEVK
ncbi:MAG TPA: F0F1 ATP synthase subunit B [Ktedonobacterales bacterium]|nr:F0F1 ATP synthase subunit B [Ktedonobacterales bacterium]